MMFACEPVSTINLIGVSSTHIIHSHQYLSLLTQCGRAAKVYVVIGMECAAKKCWAAVEATCVCVCLYCVCVCLCVCVLLTSVY